MLLALLPLLTMSQSALYDEPLRPQFHFTARTGWLNDPNGLVYFKDEYHLFFQHNPFGTQWGNMTWGHAVSKDLVHWKQVDNALEPDILGTMFSGSAVAIDGAKASRLLAGRAPGPALVCFYTAAGGTNEASKGQPFTQCLAYSFDGRTFFKFPGNPILPHLEAENRDPKVIWHEPTQRWVMALYLNESRYALYGSSDLVTWLRLSTLELPGASECPDLFPLNLDGDSKKQKWVFWGGNGRYRLGAFDGKTFTPETEPVESNFGNTAYASQTFFNDPKGRRIQIAWFRGSEFPGSAWNQQMGFPTEVRLISTSEGPRLAFQPVEELRRLRSRKLSRSGDSYASGSGLMDATIQLRVDSIGRFVLEANGHDIVYDAASRKLSALDRYARVDPVQGILKIRMLVDRASIELFLQDGIVSIPLFALPKEGALNRLRISIPQGFEVKKAEVWELRSAWRQGS